MARKLSGSSAEAAEAARKNVGDWAFFEYVLSKTAFGELKQHNELAKASAEATPDTLQPVLAEGLQRSSAEGMTVSITITHALPTQLACPSCKCTPMLLEFLQASSYKCREVLAPLMLWTVSRKQEDVLQHAAKSTEIYRVDTGA